MTSPVEGTCPHRCCTGECPGHNVDRPPERCGECLALPPPDDGPPPPKVIRL